MDNPDGTGAAEGGGTGGGLMSGAAGALLPLALGAASFMNPKAGSQMLQSLVPMLNLQMQEQAFGATERERKLTREQQAAKDERLRRAGRTTGGLVGLPPEVAEQMAPADILAHARLVAQQAQVTGKEEKAAAKLEQAGQVLGAPTSNLFAPQGPDTGAVDDALAYAPRPPATPQERRTVLQQQRTELAERPLRVWRQGLPMPTGGEATITAQIADIDKRMQQAGQMAPTEIASAFASGDVSGLLTKVARDAPEHLGQAMDMARLIQGQQQPTRTIDEISLADYGVKFAQLPLAQRQAVRTKEQVEAEKRSEAVGRGQALGAYGAKEVEQLNEKASFWINPTTGEPAQPTQTLQEVKAAKFVPITQQGLHASASARAALIQIQQYRELVPRLLPKSTGNVATDLLAVQSNRAQLAIRRAAGDPDARRFEALFGAIATLVRATGDNAGNVAVKEREFLQNFVATPQDTQESATAVLDQAEAILRSTIRSRGIPDTGAPVTPQPRPRPTGRPVEVR